jgi:UDP-GlcNAc3NAcA epimerase
MRVLTVVGARPQFVKAAAVSRALRAQGGMEEVMVHTGQHYDANMSAVFFDELGIPPPAHLLNIGSGSHGAQTGRILEAVEAVIQAERPGLVLVYGDTNSTLAGALAAAKLHVPVAHVEAGLRSFNRAMPEEVNRVLTDHLSAWLFAPTSAAVANLAREGIAGDTVLDVGDVMLDAALYHGSRVGDAPRLPARLGLAPRSYVLATIHRAENTDDPVRLRTIFDAFNRVAAEVEVVLPLHPRTRHALAALDWQPADGLRIIDPVGYLDMVALEAGARLIVTDSGGVQKEAFFHRVVCVTLRTETEWVELVQSGWNALVAPQSAQAVAAAVLAGFAREVPEHWPAVYGNGDASRKIAATLAAASRSG